MYLEPDSPEALKREALVTFQDLVSEDTLSAAKAHLAKHPWLLESMSPQGLSAPWLNLAARQDRPDMVRWLLPLTSDVNAPDVLGNTTALSAVRASSFECLQLLLTAGATVEVEKGSALLTLAAQDSAPGADRMIATLIAHGANANQCDMWGKSALSLAAAAGLESNVKALLTNGAFTQEEPPGYDAIRAAKGHGQRAIVRLLETWRHVQAAQTAIHEAQDPSETKSIRPLAT